MFLGYYKTTWSDFTNPIYGVHQKLYILRLLFGYLLIDWFLTKKQVSHLPYFDTFNMVI